MELKEFKQQIERAEAGKTFDFGISEPFSWRGIYAEVAFELLEQPMTREEILNNIDMAYKETFNGYKGGYYEYEDNTKVHFESDYGSWTDGDYCAKWIAKIEDNEPYKSQEMRLVKLAFA